MRIRKILVLMGSLALAVSVLQGCSKKNTAQAPAGPAQTAETAELPVLPQNLLPPQPEAPPAEEFEPISNDLQPPPADQEPSPQVD